MRSTAAIAAVSETRASAACGTVARNQSSLKSSSVPLSPSAASRSPMKAPVQRWISASQNKSEAQLIVQSEAAPQAFEVANVDGVGLGVIGEVILVREVLNGGG